MQVLTMAPPSPQVRLLARALRPLRVRCFELGCQKTLLRAQLHQAELAHASEASARSHLENELRALLEALSGREADAAGKGAGKGADMGADKGADMGADKGADTGADMGASVADARASRFVTSAARAARAARRWRVVWIMVTAANRLRRMSDDERRGSFLGLRAGVVAGEAGVLLAPEALIATEPMSADALQSVRGEAAALLKLLRHLEVAKPTPSTALSAAPSTAPSAGAPPTPLGHLPPGSLPWLRPRRAERRAEAASGGDGGGGDGRGSGGGEALGTTLLASVRRAVLQVARALHEDVIASDCL
jgi:hypothetical protein